MAQKINSNLFRKSLQNSEWNYKYQCLNKEEISLFTYKNVKIEKFIVNLFRYHGLFVTTLKLDFSKTKLQICISFFKSPSYKKLKIKQKTKKSLCTDLTKKFLITVFKNYYNTEINIKLKDITKSFEDNLMKFKSARLEYRKLLKKLKRFKNFPDFIVIYKIIFVVLINKKSSRLLGNIISYLISNQNKNHYYILAFIKNVSTILLKSKLSKVSGIKIKVSGRINGFSRSKSRFITAGNLPIQSLNSNIDYSETKAYTPNGTFGIKTWINEK